MGRSQVEYNRRKAQRLRSAGANNNNNSKKQQSQNSSRARPPPPPPPPPQPLTSDPSPDELASEEALLLQQQAPVRRNHHYPEEVSHQNATPQSISGSRLDIAGVTHSLTSQLSTAERLCLPPHLAALWDKENQVAMYLNQKSDLDDRYAMLDAANSSSAVRPGHIPIVESDYDGGDDKTQERGGEDDLDAWLDSVIA